MKPNPSRLIRGYEFDSQISRLADRIAILERDKPPAPPDAIAALKALLRYAERNECQHEETTRGGAIWTICDSCGMKWADDRGGFQPYKEPEEFTVAREVLERLTTP